MQRRIEHRNSKFNSHVIAASSATRTSSTCAVVLLPPETVGRCKPEENDTATAHTIQRRIEPRDAAAAVAAAAVCRIRRQNEIHRSVIWQPRRQKPRRRRGTSWPTMITIAGQEIDLRSGLPVEREADSSTSHSSDTARDKTSRGRQMLR